ncbi:Endonuclease/exonuclease/phosphatase [Rhodotorula diobovata]|uniref:Endonuclease/exonuclease/phosphatase n=1 Tax=Rhodotorula diobovata TaxID=5288 RepID=A0A5C5FVF5_9BASI|nr:Endonuclease/exonuclease/phosphatase [Rhodotorula diobovata]
MTVTAVSGDLVAIAAGVRVELWSASGAHVGWCEAGVHGFGTTDVTAMCFSQSGRYLWVGTHSGQLFEFDTTAFTEHPSFITAISIPVAAHRRDAHPDGSPIVHISRSSATEMCTIDAAGTVVIWLPDTQLGKLASLHSHSKVLHIAHGASFVKIIAGQLWAAWTMYPSATGDHKRCVVRIFDVSGTVAVHEGERTWTLGGDDSLGKVTSGCSVPSRPSLLFLGHDSGHFSIWHRDKHELLDIKKVSLVAVTALCGPSRFLWAGFDNGMMEIFDVSSTNWRVVKRWRGHRGTILSLGLDPSSLWTASSLRVFSAGADLTVRFWDGLLRQDWISESPSAPARMSRAVDSYCNFSPLKLGIFTWNVDGQNPEQLHDSGPVNKELLGSFLTSLVSPDLVVFNFQELIDLSDLTLAARTVLFATRTHDVTGRYSHWLRVLTKAVKRYLGPDLDLVHNEKLVGLFTVVFARRSIKSRIRDLATQRIKTGFNEAYGNKGSILLRLVLDDSSFCFVNAHLAAGKTHPAERERDLIEILDANPVFPRPSECTREAYVGGGDGTQVSDAEMIFFAGDLNFRIDLPREQVLRTLTSCDSPHLAFAELLPHDELVHLRRTSPSFRLRSFSEAPIEFPPTYKYDHRSGSYDTSDKQRTPSWCDRVLWRAERPKSVVCESYGRFEADISDHRPVAASFTVQVRKADPLRREMAYRSAVHDWAKVSEGLLETARGYYPPGV